MKMLRWVFLLLLVALPAAARDLPYAKAGLSQRDAAAHLLNRFTFGPRPGDVDAVVQMGLDKWLDAQLAASLPETALDGRLSGFRTLAMTDRELATTYVNPGMVSNMAQAEGMVMKPSADSPETKKEYRQALLAYAKSKGFRPVRELTQELIAQKVLRAVYSENQLREVLTDFWFNHFNVSTTSNPARPHILSYERDVIRAHALGSFSELLFGTAKHPAMLHYLNNAQSVANVNATTTMEEMAPVTKALPKRNKKAGLNENYAREVMELHTLGVDGGYQQKDVTEVARALTGWTVYPTGPRAARLLKAVEKGKAVGFVQQGDFIFRADAHDAGPKTILGRKFPAGGGVEEGEQVLRMLSQHPSTARFIARKFAARFVSDAPSPELVERLAKTFQRTHGSTRALVEALVQSPEFWSADARRAKVKSPLELVASSLRALKADIVQPRREVFQWLEKMGQPIYAYQAPTGFPDRAQTWINSGTLLNRMNFGLVLASGQLPGVQVDLAPLAAKQEKAEAQLKAVAERLLPGRDLKTTVKDLTPLVTDSSYVQKMNEKARAADQDSPKLTKAPTQLAQVVGILLGSPEFQRR